MFGETTIFHVKIWNHPSETTILKWMFQVPGNYPCGIVWNVWIWFGFISGDGLLLRVRMRPKNTIGHSQRSKKVRINSAKVEPKPWIAWKSRFAPVACQSHCSLSFNFILSFLLQQTDFEMILPQLPHPQDMIKGKLVGAGFIRKKWPCYHPKDLAGLGGRTLAAQCECQIVGRKMGIDPGSYLQGSDHLF